MRVSYRPISKNVCSLVLFLFGTVFKHKMIGGTIILLDQTALISMRTSSLTLCHAHLKSFVADSLRIADDSDWLLIIANQLWCKHVVCINTIGLAITINESQKGSAPPFSPLYLSSSWSYSWLCCLNKVKIVS